MPPQPNCVVLGPTLWLGPVMSGRDAWPAHPTAVTDDGVPSISLALGHTVGRRGALPTEPRGESLVLPGVAVGGQGWRDQEAPELIGWI